MTSYMKQGRAVPPKIAVDVVFKYLNKERGLKTHLTSLRKHKKGSESWKLLYRAYFLVGEKYPKEKLLALLGFVSKSSKKTQTAKKNRKSQAVEGTPTAINPPESGCPECGYLDPENRKLPSCPNCNSPIDNFVIK